MIVGRNLTNLISVLIILMIGFTTSAIGQSVSSIVRLDANPNNTPQVDFRVTFSGGGVNTEPMEALTEANFDLTTSGVSGASIVSFSQTGNITTIDISVNTGSGNGTIRLDFDNDAGLVETVSSYNSGEVYDIDKDNPSIVAVGPVTPDPRNTNVSSITIEFSEPIDQSSFSVSDVTLERDGGNVTISGFGVSCSGNDCTVSGLSSETTPEGDYEFIVDATGLQDPAGNNGTGSDSDTWTMDTSGPMVLVVGPVNPNPRNTEVPAISVTFSEAVDESSFTEDDLTLTRDGSNVSFGSLSIDCTDAICIISELNSETDDEGDYVLTVDATGIMDLVGNNGTGSGNETWTNDQTGPSIVSVGPVTPDPRSDPVNSIDVEFDEPVDESTITLSDITLERDGADVPISGFSVNCVGNVCTIATLTMETTPSGNYEFIVDASGIDDLAGNSGSGTMSDTWTTDAAGPMVTSVGPVTPDPRNTPVSTVDVSFDEDPNPATFTFADITLTRDGGGVTLDGTVTVSCTGSDCTISGLSSFTGADGDYEITIDASGIEDIFGNNGMGTGSDTWTMDATGPTIDAVGPVTPDPRNTSVAQVDLVFSEDLNISTFDFNDLTLQRDAVNVPLSGSVTISDEAGTGNYRVNNLSSFTGAEGNYTLTVDATGIQDALGNNGTNSDSDSWLMDTTPPTVSFSDDQSDMIVKDGDVVIITATFIEANGLNGTPTISIGSTVTGVNMTGSGLSWSYTWTVAVGGDESASVSVNVSDLAGNPVTPPPSFTYTVDNTAPDVDLTDDQSDNYVRDIDDVELTATFNEPISGTPLISIGSTITNVVMLSTPNPQVWTYMWNVPGGIDETADVTISVTDVAGNPVNAPTGTNQYIIDNTAPDLFSIDPLNQSHNFRLDKNLTAVFNEDVIGVVSNQLILHNKTDVTQESFTANTLRPSFGTDVVLDPNSNLITKKEYYVIIPAGSFRDRAGNVYAGLLADNLWAFETFGAPEINPLPVAACIGDEITLTGKYFIGVNEVVFGTSSPQTVIKPQFTIDDDNTLRVTVPDNALYGETITLKKIQGGADDNFADAETASGSTIKLGPTSAVFMRNGTEFVCDDPTSSVDQTEVEVFITGGSGSYTVTYSDGTSNTSIAGYTGGPFFVNPPSNGVNNYSLVSVFDEDVDLTSCSASTSGTFPVTQFERSQVDAGGTAGTIEICLATTSSIDLKDIGVMGILPSINGSVTDGEWTIFSGPSSGGGGFDNAGSPNPTSTFSSPTVYYPSLADAAFDGGIVLKLRSDDPTGNNPCATDEDLLTIQFVSSPTANPGPDFSICENQPTANISVTIGGGADGQLWTTTSPDGFDNTWGFSLTGSAPFSATSTDANTTYTLSPTEITNMTSTIEVVPTSSGATCGSPPSPIPQTITLVPNPVPVVSAQESFVCVEQMNTLYSVIESVGSTYSWNITNEGSYPALNEIIAGQGTSTIVVNWGNTTGMNTVSVVETDANGCPSLPVDIVVDVSDLPNVAFVEPTERRFSITSGLIPLQGNQFATVTSDSLFSGPGVVQDPDGYFFFDPAVAGTTEGAPHDITYTFTDNIGCENWITEQFDVFDPAGSIVLAGTNTVLPPELCIDAGVIAIEKSSIIIPNPGFEFHQFSGPGVTDDGNPGTFTGTFEPELAGVGLVTITFTQIRQTFPFDVIPFGQQSVLVNPLPNPSPIPIQSIYCDDDPNVDLLRDLSINPEPTFSFTVKGGDTYGIISNPNPLEYILIPSNVPFAPDDYTGKPFTIVYTYTDANGCDNTEEIDIIVFQRPPAPFANDIVECTSEPSIFLEVPDQIPGSTVTWYNNSMEFVSNNNPFQAFVTSNLTTYFVTQKINGCESNATRVDVGRIVSPEFQHEDICAGAPTTFTIGAELDNIDSAVWTFMEADGTVLDRIIENNGAISNVQQYTFQDIGAKKVSLEFYSTVGCFASDTSNMFILPRVVVTSDNTFLDDFENPSGWISWGSDSPNSSWENDIPAGNVITADNKAWITNADGVYPDFENTFVYSPCFDLSGMDLPMVSFNSFTDVVPREHGVILQYSIDGRFGEWITIGTDASGIDWYNETLITSQPGGATNPLGYGWSVDSSGWVSSKNALTFSEGNDLSNVIFRFVFAGGENGNNEGFAFDNFSITERNRTVLLEHFEDSSTPSFDQQVSIDGFNPAGGEKELIKIHYRTRFGDDDPLLTSEMNARTDFYGFITAPRAIFDGIETTDQDFDNWGPGAFDRRSLEEPLVDVVSIVETGDPGMLRVDWTVRAKVDLPDPVIVHTAIIKRDFGGKTNVLVKMLPDAGGTLVNSLAKNEEVSQSMAWENARAGDGSGLAAIVFVQNLNTQEVLQAKVIDISDLPAVTGLADRISKQPRLYPNPAASRVSIEFSEPTSGTLIVFDQYGKRVIETILSSESLIHTIDVTGLADGLYLADFDYGAETPHRMKFVISN